MPKPDKTYAVFLSFNSEDRDAVETLAIHLQDHAELRPWFDQWELIPGEPWVHNLERGLAAASTCAVFVGQSGEGPWQRREVETALRHQIDNPDFRVIPVLLPNAPKKPKLPMFLSGNMWVEFRKGLDDDNALWRLECGIRGISPGRCRPRESSSAKSKPKQPKSSQPQKQQKKDTETPARIFLSYTRKDREKVARLYQQLTEAGFRPWMDTKDILPGERWKPKIAQAIRQSDFFLACLSEAAVNKRGFIQKEIRDAMELWNKHSDSDIYLIPVRLEMCDVPEHLAEITWVDLFEEDGLPRLINALHAGMERRVSKEPELFEEPPVSQFEPPEPIEESVHPEPVEGHSVPTEPVEGGDSKPEEQEFSFEVITVNKQGEEIDRRPGSARQYIEELGNGVTLEMVAIPEGSFLMGAPETEDGSYNDERPQHTVTIAPFYMGRYPVTQTQWKVVVETIPKIDRELKPEPSYFTGAQRPVEQVSWDDAVEFCKRISQLTGRTYQLPSEAQWEYACRAGTTTPFHFGETLTPELSNYNGNSTYAAGPKGVYRKATTEVGSFPPNAFGLYDIHGNVWEWCADVWHDNHQGAPSDGSIWQSDGDVNYNVLRGGSWNLNPHYLRSAVRDRDWHDNWVYNGGFRLCVAAGGVQ